MKYNNFVIHALILSQITIIHDENGKNANGKD